MKRVSHKFSRAMLAIAVVFGLSTAVPVQAQNGLLDMANPRAREVAAVQHSVTPNLLATPGILGTAIGQSEAGDLNLIVFVNSEGANPGEAIRNLPPSIRGVGVSARLTEPFRSLAGKPGGGASHTAKQTPPIQLGTSGGWRDDLANGYCCGGTLGSSVMINNEQYILSNYHVLEADKVPGGNGIVATTDSAVIQPGLIDVGCNAGSAQNVATLVVKNSLPNNNVDVAVAKVTIRSDGVSMVNTDGAILEIGKISSQTVGASVSQAVKKSGRTTGLTRSSVVGLNASISVAYENECAGGAAFTKVFTGQIIVNNRAAKGKSFISGGDSGSLMVEDTATNPKAVGLLFAGSSSYAIANPIDEVLAFLNATMVGVAP
jgi:hypothetical protein